MVDRERGDPSLTVPPPAFLAEPERSGAATQI
jgi:hypothetical protein